MKSLTTLAWMLLCGSVLAADADKPAASTKATFSISGLHCPPCTRTVESSLKKLAGLKTAKVNWGTKSATVEFDESTLSAQHLAAAVAATPHMMGGGMHYASWLALSVPGVTDEASAAKVEAAAAAVKGVAKAKASSAQHTLSVQFSAEGDAKSQQLIDALDQAGFKATNY